MVLTSLFNKIEKVPSFSWRSLFEQTRRLKGLLLRVQLVVSGLLTKEVCLACVSFVRTVYRLRRQSGLLFTALYCKQCAVSLQRYYAGSFSKRDSLSPPVSLTRCGLPRIIPAPIRKAIRARDDRADILVRLYLSWFGLSK